MQQIAVADYWVLKVEHQYGVTRSSIKADFFQTAMVQFNFLELGQDRCETNCSCPLLYAHFAIKGKFRWGIEALGVA